MNFNLIDDDGLILCPNCKKWYKPILTRVEGELIQVSHPQATKEEREQLISGLCSSKCWNEFLGIGVNLYDRYKSEGVLK